MENPKESYNKSPTRLPNDLLGLICTDFLPRQYRPWLLLLDQSLRLALKPSFFSNDIGLSRTKQLAYCYQNFSRHKHFLADNQETILQYLESEQANHEDRLIWQFIEQLLTYPDRAAIFDIHIVNTLYDNLRILQPQLAGFCVLDGFVPDQPMPYSFVIQQGLMQIVPFEIFLHKAFGDDRTDFLQYCLNNILRCNPFRTKSLQCLKLWLANTAPTHKQAALLLEHLNAVAGYKDPLIRRDMQSLVPISNPPVQTSLLNRLYSSSLSVSHWAFRYMIPTAIRCHVWGIESVFYEALWHESHQAAHPKRDIFETWIEHRADKTLMNIFCDSLHRAMSTGHFKQRCNALHLLAILAPHLNAAQGQYMTNMFIQTVCNANEHRDVLYTAARLFKRLLEQLFFSEEALGTLIQFATRPVPYLAEKSQLSFLISATPYLSQNQFHDALAILCEHYLQEKLGGNQALETRMHRALTILFAQVHEPEQINRLYEHSLTELCNFDPRAHHRDAKPALLEWLPPYLDNKQFNDTVEAILANPFLQKEKVFDYLRTFFLSCKQKLNAANQARILQLASGSLLNQDEYIEPDILAVFLLAYSAPYSEHLEAVIKAVLEEAHILISTYSPWTNIHDRLVNSFKNLAHIVPYCNQTHTLGIVELLKAFLLEYESVNTVQEIKTVLEVLLEHKQLSEKALARLCDAPLALAPQRLIQVLQFLQNKGISSAILKAALLDTLRFDHQGIRQKALQSTFSLHFFHKQEARRIHLPSISDNDEYKAAQAIVNTL